MTLPRFPIKQFQKLVNGTRKTASDQCKLSWTIGDSARSRNSDLSRWSTCRHNGGNLAIGVNGEVGGWDAPKTDLSCLRQARTSNHHCGSDWPAGWRELLNYGGNAEILVARERRAGSRDCNGTGERSKGNCGS